MVEDIVTTGLSIRETMAAMRGARRRGGRCACLIDRSGGEADLGVPLVALARYKVPAYRADQIRRGNGRYPAGQARQPWLDVSKRACSVARRDIRVSARSTAFATMFVAEDGLAARAGLFHEAACFA